MVCFKGRLCGSTARCACPSQVRQSRIVLPPLAWRREGQVQTCHLGPIMVDTLRTIRAAASRLHAVLPHSIALRRDALRLRAYATLAADRAARLGRGAA